MACNGFRRKIWRGSVHPTDIVGAGRGLRDELQGRDDVQPRPRNEGSSGKRFVQRLLWEARLIAIRRQIVPCRASPPRLQLQRSVARLERSWHADEIAAIPVLIVAPVAV